MTQPTISAERIAVAKIIAKHTYAFVLPNMTDCEEWDEMSPAAHKVYLSTADEVLSAQAQGGKAVAAGHDWIASTMGHGTRMCSRCKITLEEASALGELDWCTVRPASPPVQAQPQGVMVKALGICDGIEQPAFEAWAAAAGYDMHEHPMHYLFLDPKTDAARMGWKAGIQHALDRAALATPPAPVDVTDDMVEAIATLYGNYIPSHGWTGFGPTPEQIAAALTASRAAVAHEEYIAALTLALSALRAQANNGLLGSIGVMEKALQQIAGSHPERFGYDQTDIEEIPDLSAEEAVSVARMALSDAEGNIGSLASPPVQAQPQEWAAGVRAAAALFDPSDDPAETEIQALMREGRRQGILSLIPAALATPLAPVDGGVTDEMVERANEAYRTAKHKWELYPEAPIASMPNPMRDALAAALTASRAAVAQDETP